MPDASLLTMFDEVRGKTLKLLEFAPEEARWTPPGTDNCLLWHAGHIFCVVERMVTAAISGQPGVPASIPRGWWDVFGWDSRPQHVPAEAWPELSHVAGQLRAQHARLRQALAKLTEDQLCASLNLPGWGWSGAPVRRLIIHAFHDEACHSGEIWLLRKLYHDGQRTD